MFNLYKIKNFNYHKQKLINLIDQIPTNRCDIDGCKISHSDWNLHSNKSKEYKEYFFNNIYQDFGKQICKNFNCDYTKIESLWFQVYKKNDFHPLHRHGLSNFTNILYLNLPTKKTVTKIFDLNKKQLDFKIEEGDILTFPAFLLHQSPINIDENPKYIIAFNMDIT